MQSQWVGAGILVTALWMAVFIRPVDELGRRLVMWFGALSLGLLGARLGAVANGIVPWSGFFDPSFQGLTTSGAALVLGVGALALWRAGHFGRLNTVAGALFVVLGFARLGCVFNGCDFGRHASWGIAYSRPASAWQADVLSGLDMASQHSWPTFPFPVCDALQAFGAAAVVAVASRGGQGGWVAKNAVPLGAIWYFVGRFFWEFGRSPVTSVAWGGLNRPQWFSLVVAVVLCGFLIHQGLRHERVSASDP